ncbi:MAG: DUF4832 domain-containing protein [Cyclobacteriaceae bacterium]|nr:DUF4832 domain-containing protein [Cyclobacteriaceae bacterium]
MLDNGVENYTLSDTGLPDSFPGMDHMYLRLAWSYLEPEEDKFDWHYIDDEVEKYVARGYKIAFKIACKETGKKPHSVGQEQNGVQYATPVWIEKAGAKGQGTEVWDVKSWTPDWDDPIYLEKLHNFHWAFAERYDGEPWVSYIGVGSIGEWGEGHTSFSTRVPPTFKEVKAHIDLHLDHYKKNQLVVTDDLLYYGKNEDEVNELYQYAVSKGITLRDDSLLVGYYVDVNIETFSVSHPHFYDLEKLKKPTILVCQHYHMVLEDGNWIGKNGEKIPPEKTISGADILRGAIQTMLATFIGYHGYLEQWLRDNPDLTRELANLCGYWYFPKSIEIPAKMDKAKDLGFSITWLNKGVAPAYNQYEIECKLESDSGEIAYLGKLSESDNLTWLPDSLTTENYSIASSYIKSKGIFNVKLKLTDPKTREDVALGLSAALLDNQGFYNLATVEIN